MRLGEVRMPGAGTDKTKNWIETPAPIVVLVEPQLGENIGGAGDGEFWPVAAAACRATPGLAERQGEDHGVGRGPRARSGRVVQDGRRRHRRLLLRACDNCARTRSGQA